MRILIKATVKTHRRTTPTGKTITVRQYEDSRTKKPDDPKQQISGTTDTSASKVGLFLKNKGIPISNAQTKTSGIALRNINGKLLLKYVDWSNNDGGGKLLITVKEHLRSLGLNMSQSDKSGYYTIDKSGNISKPKVDEKISLNKIKNQLTDVPSNKKPDPKKTTPKKTKDGDNSLTNDAKKYKSAEDFVQSYNPYHNSRNINDAQKGEIVLITPPDKIDIWFGDKGGGLKYNGALYGEFEIIKKNPKTILVKNVKSKEEYVVSKESNASKDYSLISKNKITTKEQLIDIWNKANKKPIKKSLNPMLIFSTLNSGDHEPSNVITNVLSKSHSRVELKQRNTTIKSGYEYHQGIIDNADTNQTLKEHYALAINNLKNMDSFIWLRERLLNYVEEMLQWQSYDKTAPSIIKHEYIVFWTKVADMYKKAINYFNKSAVEILNIDLLKR